MNDKKIPTELSRRQFLKNSSLLAASALLFPLGGAAIPKSRKMALPHINNVVLNNGLEMPVLGFGTYTLRGQTCVQCVSDAIKMGYRLIDTATIYENEEFVGAGIRQSGINRKELFITSKVWVSKSGYADTKLEFEKSLKKLGTDYLDLYLIHRPYNDYKGAWKAMVELYNEGKIKAIGVSNFETTHLNDILPESEIVPAVNQIETHAFFQQQEAYEVLKEHDIKMEAWAPFAEGRNGLFTNDVLAEIGKKYNKTNAQVSLRWHYQRGIIAIPRTTKTAHMSENLDVFDFELNASDMAAIEKLDLNKTQFPEW